jgi:hypothetical protein
MINFWLYSASLALVSIFLAEIVRDLFHIAGHIWPPLIKWHNLHHRVFRPDLTAVNTEIYQQATWFHDVPEAVTMLVFNIIFWIVAYIWLPAYHWAAGIGAIYTVSFLIPAIARAKGLEGVAEATDLTHAPGPFTEPPTHWLVNRTYHWRHHFDDTEAYFCGTLTLTDRLLGTALSLKGKTVAVTGANGTLGRSLLKYLHLAGAKTIALTSQEQPINLSIDQQEITVKTITWQIGAERELLDVLKKVDILIINHGINVHGDRSLEAINQCYEVNTFSVLRLMETFFQTVQTNQDIAKKEVWVNTSEAEVNPAFSPLYELTKRAVGDLVTMERLDAPCVVRKLILGPFKSNLNPVGIMSADRVAKKIIKLAKSDFRNIIVTVNPITMVAFPIKEFLVSLYFKFFTRKKELGNK